MSDEGHIRAKFMVTRKSVTIYARYQEVSCVLRWDRDRDNPDRQSRHIRTLIGNLDQLVADGLNEVVVQVEMADLDNEWQAFSEPPPAEETE